MTVACQSCGMNIETGQYCQHCTDENGQLQAFDVRFSKMVKWMLRQNQGLSRSSAESQVRRHMAEMPAWRDRPEFKKTI
jgi:type II secretory pathway component PulM